jgi:oligoribonuclease (3'-5' exoribonuclease)
MSEISGSRHEPTRTGVVVVTVVLVKTGVTGKELVFAIVVEVATVVTSAVLEVVAPETQPDSELNAATVKRNSLILHIDNTHYQV